MVAFAPIYAIISIYRRGTMPRQTVPLPESGIIVRRGGKYQYVYKVLCTYRNEKGQPSNDRKLIGRLDAGGRLIPNDSYFDYFEEARIKAAYSAEIGHSDRRALYTVTGETEHPFRRD
jgi:hypothetical protein